MKESANEILVGTLGKQVCVKVEGKGTHLISQPLREFLFEMIDSGYRSFQIDLRNCTYMDSTFLGMLVGVSMRLRNVGPGTITLLRINQRNLELFKTLGIEQFFQFQSDTPSPAESKAKGLHSLPPGKVASQEWAETMLEAHETLAQVDQKNECRFKDVITFLKEDLAKIKAGKTPLPGAPDQAKS